ncbi:hypothetical protein SARC_07528 [Sphaeroforma arctica JP610]|uniref:DUF6989 domain-containing protein n=1 Tax=Sphaeroforma arctica JP610 TaxID=667725 RepID=A0A0L0FTF5_9EUKA|nr:hypothetical protein SARC_07528 [Sphaeroforma arctica JP610]KNC80085.1 hypothetical protein SARC_07528 [Sphaeroforma arctica JP610]|eukprot:XP_014153987.1 hypothetical protein SARC_07528 [Sphaeroforma arctica JP610]
MTRSTKAEQRKSRQGAKPHPIHSSVSSVPQNSRTDIRTDIDAGWEYEMTKFHICFQLAAMGVLLTSPNQNDVTLLVLMVGYHFTLYWRILSKFTLLWDVYVFLVPLSVAMVIPDWILSQELDILVFQHKTVLMIGTVPTYMAFMWVMPLIITTLTGETLTRRGYSKWAVNAAIVGVLARFIAAVNVMLLYVGASVTCYFLVERVDYSTLFER